MSFWNLYLQGFLVSILFFVIIWFASLVTKKNSIIDAAWGLHYFLISFYYFLKLHHPLTTGTLTLLVIISFWGLRLGGFLFYRYLKIGEDHRYETIKKNWNANDYTFIKMFIFQGAVAGLISLTMLVSFWLPLEINVLFTIGALVMIVFTFFEALADYQLLKFVSLSQNKYRICNIGLWKFSRHPNYFSEWMIWLGLLIIALGQPENPYKLFAFLGPVMIYLLLNYVSGIPIIEKEARLSNFRKIGEQDYHESTPAFFPKFKE